MSASPFPPLSGKRVLRPTLAPSGADVPDPAPVAQHFFLFQTSKAQWVSLASGNLSLSLSFVSSVFFFKLTDDLAKYLDQMLVVLENNCERKGEWGLRALSLQKCLAYHHLNYAL